MAKKKFTEKDIQQLLQHYRGERRRLVFQLEGVKKAIRELRAMGTGAAAPTEKTAATKKRAAAPKRKSGPRKKRVAPGGYRLSGWDDAVMNAVKGANRMMTKQQLLDVTKKWAAKNEPKTTAAEVEAKLTRALQKLSGRRGMLGTYRTGLQRGYHYGLKDWFFKSTGKLRPAHLDKLVIER
ncbi:MAG: hypothetical protein IT228_06110 [Flavobacteriales bacterium]|nr:hypothetical protein [Flavobacteriales bacterium]MCC6576899.1 hypothetical protein [Flavobacteriales bacterium]NUQ14063.1 hypothetical protein [Flavobacteriales bacterium]